MANKKACKTADKLKKKLFYECFVPEVKRYLEQKDLEFKVLLLIDNAPSQPELDQLVLVKIMRGIMMKFIN